ncbi:MAG: tRNA (adenosine(37)-N6)-dimethylallyltransferase MiaA [Ignavibacteria bacterium]|nr:tRNA (adenosine(37)-N6)-dimethylallyltransferase MiaA [Ignavibacteria bacterium]
MNYNLITILGPTATGKTKLAAQLAHRFNGEIISADSRQVYKGMDIGTGKDLSDYVVDNNKIPYHLIDIAAPETEFNLFEFTKHFKEAFKKIISKDKIPFLTGGTGLYISSVVQNYQLRSAKIKEADITRLSHLSFEELQSILTSLKPKLHNKTDLEHKERLIKAILIAGSAGESLLKDVKINSLVIGVRFERGEIKKRITERLKKRLNEGMIEEVQQLIDSGVSYERLLKFGLEYKFIALYLKGEMNYNNMFLKLNSAISAFAKRQMTWFRKMEREGVKINWIDKADFNQAADLISDHTFVADIKS